MKKTTLLLTGLATLLAPSFGYAQAPATIPPPVTEDDGIGLSFNGSFSGVGKTKLKSGNTRYNEVSSTSYSVGVSQFIPLGDDFGIEAGLNYSRTSLTFETGRDRLVPLPKRLQSLSLSLNTERPINDRWSAMLGTSFVSSTAGSGGFKSKGFGVDVFAAANYEYSPTLTFTGGVAYSSLAKGTTQLFPVIGVNWTPSPQWTVALGVPETGVIFNVSDSFSLGLVAAGQGGAYYVETDPLPGAAGKPNLAGATLDHFDVGAALRARWQASKQFGVMASVGSIFSREFEYESRKLKIKSDGAALYYELGVQVSF